jgi:hypothetical protein
MEISPSSLILVAVINKPRDLEIARLLGWYRIPLRSAPKVVSVDYLAFYLTGAFGEQRWTIPFTARVLGHELTTRAELLKDEPDHPRSREEYYKIQIGSLTPLPQPIRAGKWRRVTFLYTTGEYLVHANTVNDLVVQSEERETLWQALRERSNQVQAYNAQAQAENEVDPAVLALLLGFQELDRHP